MRLYEIAQEELDLMVELDELDGEITPEVEERLQINEGNRTAKMEGYCKACMHYDTKIEAAKVEIERLRKLIKRSERNQEWLKNSMLEFMKVTERNKVDAGLFTVGTRKSTSVDVFNEDQVPEQFKTQVVTTKIDKMAIKDALKNGEEIHGAQLVEKKSISIR